MTRHFFKGAFYWELQIGTRVFQLRHPGWRKSSMFRECGVKPVHFFTTWKDPFGEWRKS
jgi:hypothetical protein